MPTKWGSAIGLAVVCSAVDRLAAAAPTPAVLPVIPCIVPTAAPTTNSQTLVSPGFEGAAAAAATSPSTLAPATLTPAPGAPTPAPTAPTPSVRASTPEPKPPTLVHTAPSPTPIVRSLADKVPTTAPTVSAPTPFAMHGHENVADMIAHFENSELTLLPHLPQEAPNGSTARVAANLTGAKAIAQIAQRLFLSQVDGDTATVDGTDFGVYVNFPVAELASMSPDVISAITLFDSQYLGSLSGGRMGNGSNVPTTVGSTNIQLLAAVLLTLRDGTDSAKLSVSGLDRPIRFKIPFHPGSTSEKPQCMYFDEVAGAWSPSGVTTLSVEDEFLVCETTHLCLFGGVVSAVDSLSALEDGTLRHARHGVETTLECGSAADVLSIEGLKNFVKLDMWLLRPATVWLLVMSVLYALVIVWSFEQERMSRNRFYWSDERWHIVVKDEGNVKAKSRQSFAARLCDELGVIEILEAKKSQETGKKDSWLRKLFVVASCRILVIYVRMHVGFDFLCTRSCVREFVRSMFETKQFFVAEEEEFQFMRSLRRADARLTPRRFDWSAAVLLTFIHSHPWITLSMFDCQVPSPIRAAGLAVSVSTCFVACAWYFHLGAESLESPPGCNPYSWDERLLWSCCVGVLSLSVAWIPSVVIQLVARRHAVMVPQESSRMWSRTVQAWQRKDKILWGACTVYIIFSIFYCTMFVAGVSEADAADWFVSGVAASTYSLFFGPLLGSMAFSTAVRLIIFHGSKRIRRAQRKVVGLQFVLERFAIMVQSHWRGRMARKKAATLLAAKYGFHLQSSPSNSTQSSLSTGSPNRRRRSPKSRGLRTADNPFKMMQSSQDKMSRLQQPFESGLLAQRSPSAFPCKMAQLQQDPSELPTLLGHDPRRKSSSSSSADFVHSAVLPTVQEHSPVPKTFGAVMLEIQEEPSEWQPQDVKEGNDEEPEEVAPWIAQEEVEDTPSETNTEVGPVTFAPPTSRAMSHVDEQVDEDPFASPLQDSSPSASNLQVDEQPFVPQLHDSSPSASSPQACGTSIRSSAASSTDDGFEARQQSIWLQLKKRQAKLKRLMSKRGMLAGELELFLTMSSHEDNDPTTRMVQVEMVRMMKQSCCPKEDRLRAAVMAEPSSEAQAHDLLAKVESEIASVEGAVAQLQEAVGYLNSCLFSSTARSSHE